jgi:coatomer subunit beta'
VRRIDVVPKDVIWSEDGTNVVLVCSDNFYVLRHDKTALAATLASGEAIDDDGIEAAFDLISEISEKVVSGLWVSDCFVYVSSSQRLHCLVAGCTETIAHLDRAQYLLGYMPEQSKLYLVDKELNVVPYTLHLALVEYQSAIMRKDFDAGKKFFDQLPESLHNRVARFLENQGYAAEALEISKDDDHCFELATQLGKLEQAADYIRKISAQANPGMLPRGKWKQLGDVALEQGSFELARSCFTEAKDLGALFLVHTACGDAADLRKTAKQAREAGVSNIAVLCFLLLGDLEEALQVLIAANRLPEAAFFARCYCPSQLSQVVKLWKGDLAAVNAAVAESLADPEGAPALFPELENSLAAEKAFKQSRERAPPAAAKYAELKAFQDELNVMEKIKEMGPAAFSAMLMQGAGGPAVAAAPPSPVAAKSPVAAEPVAQIPAPTPEPTPTPAPAPAPEVAQAPPPIIEKPVVDLLDMSPTPETVVEATPAPGPEVTQAVAPEEDLLGDF